MQRAINMLKRYTVNQPHSSGAHDLGESIGGAGAWAPKKKVNGPEVPTHDPSMYNTYMKGTGAATGMAMEGARAEDSQAMLDKANENVRVNGMAEQARMGGAFTPNGLEDASKTAEANGADRLRLRSMLGLAATKVPGPGMGPGSF